MEQGGTITLLPKSKKKLEIKIPGENRPLFWGVVVFVVSILIFAGLQIYVAYLRNQLTGIGEELVLVEEKRDKKFEKELVLLDKRFAVIGNILGNHLVWSNALIRLQNRTPAQVQYDTLLGDVALGKFNLKAKAASYTVIARQIASLLSEEGISDVDLNKVTAQTTGLLEYDMQIFFDKNKLLTGR